MGKPKEERKPWEGYSVDSLRDGIKACEVNIVTFQDAIKRERETIANYKWMIDKLAEKKEQAIEAYATGKAIQADIKRQNDEFEADARARGRKIVHVKGQEKGNGDKS
jgi:hypothetical protein